MLKINKKMTIFVTSIAIVLFCYFVFRGYVITLVADFYDVEVRDREVALRLYDIAADWGYPPAQLKAGEMYLSGRAGKVDREKGFELIKAAAKQDFTEAEYELAYLYGQKGNDKEACKWYKISAEKDYVFSYYETAQCYHQGKVFKKDLQEAIKWYKKDIDNHGRRWSSRYNYGLLLLEGNPTEKDLKKASALIQDAMDKGLYLSQYEINELNKKGLTLKTSDTESN
ncbi:tetratricopeptide repeat protein [Zooshikella ganghwensis]|uniref:Sel1 repeat family protein n=1 Tax=Zooshikella ganghwensis TaxID=202772 RepID=A0A4P9VHH0_9GAMM|nr:tetratricopeptide repeat protein [Zooshikella ganghwensis]RDH41769.1 sel1 repeat family protein [Zooshikella ganghwensis]RDH41936.1 sel1 repeat family protein [Zooshikella ganghwensis]